MSGEGARRRSTRFLIGIVAVFVLYLVADLIYRLVVYHRLKAGYEEFSFWTTELPLYVFDPQIGYRYNPGVRVQLRMHDAEGNLLHSSAVQVNNHGHLSPRDDQYDKPASEFRIGVLGDSFTACPHSDVSWPTLLEHRLNEDERLKQLLECSNFKVINLGQDGTGIVQFAVVDGHEVSRYDADLVIVNFITDDITRRFIYRNSLSMRAEETDWSIMVTSPSLPATFQNTECVFGRNIVVQPTIVSDKERIVKIKRHIYQESVRSLPWLSPYPGLLARATGERFGLKRQIEFNWNETNPRYDPGEALSVSLEALGRIQSRHRRLLILYHPSRQELLAGETPPLGRQLLARGGEFRIVRMAEFLPSATEEEIRRWFNRDDAHPSNSGAQVYARTAHERLRQYLVASIQQ